MDTNDQPLVGGRYLVENGVRKLVEEPTIDHPAGNRAREADGKPVSTSDAPATAAEPTVSGKRRKGAE